MLANKITPNDRVENLAGPKLEEIIEATKHIQPHCESPPAVNIENSLFQNDVRIVIIKFILRCITMIGDNM